MNPEIRSKIDKITDILWAGGVTNPVTYIEQISYLIYLKLLDETAAQQELQQRLSGSKNGTNGLPSLFPAQAERFRWSQWRFMGGPELRDFVRDQVFPYMASLVKEQPEAAQYFRDAVLEIVDPNVLKQVIDILDSIDFGRLGPDAKGDLFEYLLTHLGQSALNGQFRTPRQIRAFMVEMVDPDIGDTVLDPACGTGGFLADAYDYILAKHSENPEDIPIYGEEWLERASDEQKSSPNLQKYRRGTGDLLPDRKFDLLLNHTFTGFDVSRQMVRIATMNMVLRGLRSAVRRANVLSEHGGLSDEEKNRRYSVVLMNPPFAGTLQKESVRSDLPTSSKKTELLFLGLAMDALADGGRCAIVVPEGLLFGSTKAHVELRRKLTHDFELLAVISLPAGVFKPYAGVKTAVLVFRKPDNGSKKNKAQTKKVWFYEVQNDGFDPDRIVGGGRLETPEKNQIPDMLRQWKAYKESGFRSPPGVEAGALLEPGTEPPRCWWAKMNDIAENGFNLAAGRYKPQVAEKPPDEDPAQLIREVLQTEREIQNGLEKLLKDVESVS